MPIPALQIFQDSPRVIVAKPVAAAAATVAGAAATDTSRIEYWVMIWTAINAVITLGNVIVGYMAAKAAKQAASVSSEGLRDQRIAREEVVAQRIAERQSDYFRALVVDPALESIPQFRSDALRVIGDGAKKITLLGPARPKEEFDRLTMEMTRAYNELYQPLADQMLARAKASGNEQYTIALRTALLGLQDDVTTNLRRVMADLSLVSELETAIDSTAAEILGLAMKSDLDSFRAACAVPESMPQSAIAKNETVG